MKREKLSSLIAAKEEMRRRMRATLRELTPEARVPASLEICRRAADLPAFRAAKLVALFAPLPSEPNIQPLIEEAWAQAKEVAFPLMLREVDTPRLEWRLVASWDDLTVAGPFGLREPDPLRCSRLEMAAVECVFIPGFAFDARGGRLGRGGGYYDSALAHLDAKTRSIGLMFACQQVPEIPREPHDCQLESVVTENGLLSETTR